MSIEHVSTCPAWCDPRTHLDLDYLNSEHREIGLTFAPLASDTSITMRLLQFEERGQTPSRSDVMIQVTVVDTDSGLEVAADLSPVDARMYAAALVHTAERAEAEERRVASTGWLAT